MNYRYDSDDSEVMANKEPENEQPETVLEPFHTASSDGEAENTPPVVFSAPTIPMNRRKPDETDSWQEPPYYEAPKEEAAYTPGLAQGAFYAPPKRETRRDPVNSPPPRRGGFVRALCLVIVCALVSTAASVGVVRYGLTSGSFNIPQTQVVLGATPTPDASPVAGTDEDKIITAGDITAGDLLTGQEIYSLATKQVVCVATEITSSNPFYSGSSVYGSGFILSEDGYILTNYHVVESAHQYNIAPTVILRDGTSYNAKIVGYEQNNDIAVLKIEAQGLSSVKIGSSANMQVGESIYAVGNPRRLDYTMTDGIISAIDREVQVDSMQGYTINMFQISAAVNSGNSGGPVYNERGEVLGIVTAKYGTSGSEGLGFAIPIDDAMNIAQELITKGYVSGKAQLGVTVDTMDKSTADYYGYAPGAFVYTVTRGSCAEKAGLRPGDIITKVGDREITSSDDLKVALRDFRAGDTVMIEIFRDDARIELEVTFDEQISTP